MDAKNTTMQDLSVSLKKAKDDLDSLYKKIGVSALRSEAAKYASSQQDAPQSLSDWQKLMQEREAAADSVLAIMDSLKRKQDLGKTEKDLAKSLSDAKKRARDAGARFVAAFWDDYSPDLFPSFAPVYDAAKADKESCEEIEERRRSVSDGVEEGKALSKMMAHFRGAGLQAQLYYKKSRFEQSAGAAMEALATDGGAARLAEELRAAGLAQIPESFASFNEAANEILSILQRMESSASEKQAVNDALKANDAAENPSRRLDALRTTIKEKDAAIDNICRSRGADYAALFFDEKGKPLPNAKDAASDEFGQQLLEVSRLAAQCADLERQIEVLKTEAKIKQLDKTIAAHNAEISSINKRIESMNARVESLEKAIGDISSEKAGLQSYLDKILAEDESPGTFPQDSVDQADVRQEGGGQNAEDAEIVGES